MRTKIGIGFTHQNTAYGNHGVLWQKRGGERLDYKCCKYVS